MGKKELAHVYSLDIIDKVCGQDIDVNINLQKDYVNTDSDCKEI